MIENTLRLLRPAIRELKAYKSARSLGLTGDVELDANESPWAPAVGGNGINRYPEPQPVKMLAAMADLYEVSSERLIVGRGSDEAIDMLVRAFCEAGKDAILICPPTYGMYEVAAQTQGAEVRRLEVSERNHFAIDAGSVVAAWTPATKIVFLCSPNNPTGGVIPSDTIARIAQALDGKSLVVVDEAYIEFTGTPSFAKMASDFPNVVVLRTLSKAWALAGARCGVAIGQPELIRVLQKVRAPYPLPSPVIALVTSALDERGRANCRERVKKIVEARKQLESELVTLELVDKIYPSDANFLLVKSTNGPELIARCLAKGVVIRDRGTEPGLANCVRITVGSPPENQRLVDAISGRETPTAKRRTVSVTRTTKETAIRATVDLDGEGESRIDTGIPYFDHMLEQISKHGGFDLSLQVQGDLQVDEHHTVEDTALVLGECLSKALGDRMGIGRYGFLLPMDESEAKVSLDLSGRPYLVFEGKFNREYVGELPTELVSHFFRSLSDSLRATLHVEVKGENAHHMVEACFKAVGRSLRQAIAPGAKGGLPSTKGVL